VREKVDAAFTEVVVVEGFAVHKDNSYKQNE
jgi:hypothetical protein